MALKALVMVAQGETLGMPSYTGDALKERVTSVKHLIAALFQSADSDNDGYSQGFTLG
jgi:hypothetical protein